MRALQSLPALPRIHVLPSSHYVLLSLLFFLGLEFLVAFHRWLIILSGVLLLLLVYGIVLVRIEERGRFHPTQAILPVLTAAGLTSFMFFLPRSPLLHLYAFLASIIFFWLLKHGARQAYPTWNWTLSTLVLFLDIAVILGLQFHLFIPLLVTLFLCFIIIFLVCVQAWRRVTASLTHALLLSGCLALVLTQVVWAVQFLPIHFVVQAGLVVALYYLAFHLVSLSVEQRLTRRVIVEYTVLGSVALLMLLLSAQWT